MSSTPTSTPTSWPATWSSPRATGAWIGYGAVAQTEYASRSLVDGERIELGDVVLEIVETPGHTPESISVLVYEHRADAVPYGVLTGDALFIGDVGRPDLLASIGFTADELGRQLYDSIQHKLMRLPDEVRVFPAHGAGSACGKNLSTELQSTIGAAAPLQLRLPADERGRSSSRSSPQDSRPRRSTSSTTRS